MRLTRLGITVITILVSLLAVAGFAAFAPTTTETATESEEITTPATSFGGQAGEVAALAFQSLTSPVFEVEGFDTEQLNQELELEQTYLSTPSTQTSDTVTQTTTAAPYRLGAYLSEIEIRELVSRYFRIEDVNRAIRVAWCESSFNPNNVNPESGAAGLFQHLPQFWEERSEAAGFLGHDILNPDANVGVAAWLVYEGGGWNHWSCRA